MAESSFMQGRSTTQDPVLNYKFQVSFDVGDTIIGVAGFSKVSGIKETQEAVKYREGNDPITPMKLFGQVEFSDVTLEHGLQQNGDLVKWRKNCADLSKSGNVGPDGDPQGSERGTMSIRLYNYPSSYSRLWVYYQCWPRELEITEFDALANAVTIEKMVVANEGFTTTTS